MTTDAMLCVGVPRETMLGENRVALIPGSLANLSKAGVRVLFEPGCGNEAFFPDEEFTAQGGTFVSRDELFAKADVILQVRAAGANPHAAAEDLPRFRDGQILIAACDPLGSPVAIRELADRGVMVYALEMLPRITRAQSMDILSSMATIAGYKAVLLAANHLPRIFPMMMTAAGTLTPARVFVLGAGVAGLQAVATSRKLGAVVQAFDVRPAVREEVESLGARFVEVLPEASDEGQSGAYAQQMSEDFYRRQRELMSKVVAESDVVISTAVIPGKPAPLLIPKEAVAAMKPGSVIVDLAAERGGNCELTEPDKAIVAHGVTILGPTNLPAQIPRDASQMYARNVATFLQHLISHGLREPDLEDAILKETLVARGGEVVHPRLREAT